MKPLFLELQAFGPFVEKQTVDFDKLSKSGIFLIKGETGSGKTTIFDAMSFALYGRSTGEDEKSKSGRNDLEQWRCNRAADTDPTVISFTFEANGKKYVFTRKLVRKRKNLSLELGCVEIDEQGNERSLFNNPKKDDLAAKAEELIGLNHEQFCQVVLLPQGKFEKFLTADSNNKEAILRNIFATQNWGSYAGRFYDAAKTRYDALKKAKDEIEVLLRGENLTTIDELAELIESKKQALTELEENHKAFGGTQKQAKLDADKELSGKFVALRKLQNTAKQLADAKPVYDAKKAQYEQAERAEELRKPIDDAAEAVKNKNARNTQLAVLNGKLPNAELAEKTAQAAYDKKKAESPVDSLTKRIGELNAKEETYGKIDGLKADCLKADKIRAKAESDSKKAEAVLKTATEKAAAALTASNNADAEAKRLRTRYYAGIYGEIAAELVENEKCPVCGSTHHPEPAQKAADSVSKADVDKGEELAEMAKRSWDTAEKQRTDADMKAKTAKDALAAAENAFTMANTTYESAKGSLIEGIADTAALKAEITNLENKIKTYNTELDKLSGAKDAAVKAHNDLKANIANAKEELEKAGDTVADTAAVLASALAAKGFSSAEDVKPLLMEAKLLKALNNEIVTYKTRCSENAGQLAEAAKALEGLTEPDSELFAQRQKEISDENNSFVGDRSTLVENITRLSEIYKKLDKEAKRIESEIVRAQDDYSFAKSLIGTTGESLERYVLGIMFNQVLGEANRMLTNMHGGRYYLERSEESEGSSRKSGLDLLVHDNRATSPENAMRSVRMLSGGEKFLVSLALSIGLSTFAQKSGVHIEALFIDEGFGTLDDSSINDAMSILETVRGKSGMIGIISHVSLLEGTISTHLDVVKSEKGSSIRPV